MNLTPEQKATGKENFYAALGSDLMQRKFLEEGMKKGIASGNGLGSYYYGYGEKIDKPIRVAALGTGDEGSVLLGAINPEFIQIVAIADIRPYNVHRAFHGDYYSPTVQQVRCGLMKKYGWKTEEEARKNVKVYGDYRQLLDELDSSEYDAVIIGLPLFLHAPAAIAAMKKGKHVLTEKLMGHSVAECKEMARVAEETKLHLATGHQRHYNVLYANANKMIEKGILGDLHYIRAQWHRGNLPGKDSWQQPLPQKAKPSDALASKLMGELTSWENKLKDIEKSGNASEIELWANKIAQKKKQIEDEVIADRVKDWGYNGNTVKDDGGKTLYECTPLEELIRWRLWNRTGGGLMAELGSHQLDAASIFISAVHGGEKQYPLCVNAASNRPIFPPDRDIDDHIYCLFEFPAPGYDAKDPINSRKRISVAYASINGNGFGGYGEAVFGTEGTLLLEKEKEALLFRTHSVDDKVAVVKNGEKSGDVGELSIKLNDKGDPISAAVAQSALGDDVSRGYTEELEHWAWCISNPDAPKDEHHGRPHCHPKVALADAVIALTTNIAAEKGERIDFKKEWFDIHSDETPDGSKVDLKKYS